MKNMMIKSAVAAAVTMAFAGQALAAVDLKHTAAADGTVVLAHEIFGNGNPGTGSAETLVQMKSVTLDLDAAGAGGDVMTNAQDATIKFTLGQASVFGEDLSTTSKVRDANGGAGAFAITTEAGASAAVTLIAEGDAVPAAGAANSAYWQYKVEQGGAIGDNTITIRLTYFVNGDTDAADANLTLQEAILRNVKVKNLQSALHPTATPHAKGRKIIELGVEYVETDDTIANADADAIAATATDVPVEIFGSKNGVKLASESFSLDKQRRINVGDAEKLLTNTVPGTGDFTSPGVADVLLGSVTLSRDTYTCAQFPEGVNCAGTPLVKKENGDDFDFQGGDLFKLELKALSAVFGSYSSVYLNQFAVDPTISVLANGDQANCASTNTSGGVTGTLGTVNSAKDTVNFTLTGATTDLTKEFAVCATTNGTTKITEINEASITPTYTIDYFNSRYDNDVLTASAYGPLRRNGCIASFFNIPASDNATDVAYVRLTNTSEVAQTGEVRGTLYDQDGGTAIASDFLLGTPVAQHGTIVLTSGAADVPNTTTGQTVWSIEKAAGVAPGTFKGRARLVLTGAFPVCEGLGLISRNGGPLVNMTATTQGNNLKAAADRGNNAQ